MSLKELFGKGGGLLDGSAMDRRTVHWIASILLTCLLCFAGISGADPVPSQDNPIPKEPGWKAPEYRGWELWSVPGLITTFYDLDLDGKLDYQVIRKIIRKIPRDGTSIKQAIDSARIDNLTVYVSHPVIYFTSKYPLFYCLGVDFRRNCYNIWVDIAEDGLNGNETMYTLSKPQLGVR